MIAITKVKCDQIKCIADHFGTSHVLRRAGEEYSEATTAIIHYTRASVDLEGDLHSRKLELAGELADTLIMLEQLLHVVPDLHRLVASQIACKVNRTLKRYDIPTPEVARTTSTGARLLTAKEID